jgi:predicted N-acetyltransferase YhbS
LVDSFVCRPFEEKDAPTVKRLVESTFTAFMRGKFWDWKYCLNPCFDPELVAVAEAGGEIVGCNHWLPRSFKLSGSSTVDALLAADIAVNPEYRKKGVGRALMHFLRSSESAKNRKTAVIYMFANPELRKHFHSPIGGYVQAPSGTVCYTKVLSWKKVIENATIFSEALKLGKFGRSLDGVDLTVLFKIRDSPPLLLSLNKDGVVAHEVAGFSAGEADMVLASDVATLSKVKMKGNSRRALLGALLTGKLRVRGKLSKMFSLYRNLWVLQEVLSGKIT